jgi:hypothetical protein
MDRKHPRKTIVGEPIFMLKVFSKYLIGCCVEQRVNIGWGRLSCLTMKLHHVFDSLMSRSTIVHQIVVDRHHIHDEAESRDEEQERQRDPSEPLKGGEPLFMAL